MILEKKRYLIIFFILFSLIFLFFLVNIYLNKLEKDTTKAAEPIVINLLTSVHPSLPWRFKSVKSKTIVRPGDVTTIEYTVKNLENTETTGIATFAYFPNQFGTYIRKLNCFCYDAKTLKANQEDTYSVVLLIDPEVTKDSKTKNTKEVTIQFNFFNYKEYKENKI